MDRGVPIRLKERPWFSSPRKLRSGRISGKWVQTGGGKEKEIPLSFPIAQADDRFQKFLDSEDMLNNN